MIQLARTHKVGDDAGSDVGGDVGGDAGGVMMVVDWATDESRESWGEI